MPHNCRRAPISVVVAQDHHRKGSRGETGATRKGPYALDCGVNFIPTEVSDLITRRYLQLAGSLQCKHKAGKPEPFPCKFRLSLDWLVPVIETTGQHAFSQQTF